MSTEPGLLLWFDYTHSLANEHYDKKAKLKGKVSSLEEQLSKVFQNRIVRN